MGLLFRAWEESQGWPERGAGDRGCPCRVPVLQDPGTPQHPTAPFGQRCPAAGAAPAWGASPIQQPRDPLGPGGASASLVFIICFGCDSNMSRPLLAIRVERAHRTCQPSAFSLGAADTRTRSPSASQADERPLCSRRCVTGWPKNPQPGPCAGPHGCGEINSPASLGLLVPGKA